MQIQHKSIRRWNNLSALQKTAIVAAGTVQAGLFAAAWLDLSRRQPGQLNGTQAGWRAALFLNFIGPLAYFARGRKQSDWSETDMPDQSGKVAIVTGANSGLGYETARALAQHGATVVMACRNAQKAEAAAGRILATGPRGKVIPMSLDLGDLDSVRAFADDFKGRFERLDLLVNNAGIMVPPQGETAQGFETQFGVNHLGHFALTAQLIDVLNATPDARVVNLSSIAHRFGKIEFDDLNWKGREYKPMPAYGQSKLANLLFTYELQRRLQAAGKTTVAVAAHPGYAATGLQGEGMNDGLMGLIAQTQEMGALPSMYAATAPGVEGGEFFGPSGLAEIAGHPQRVESNARSHDAETARQLWKASEELTGVPFAL
ncbi:oxidoreductase [Deinococcus marmoris]|uniref:Oxidoreductase/Short-chain dehydrogenase n=1 Tax=Deinococcus marmoris TaxID=249408 RepID=A0A1U7NRS2_9DEIO|nr:oxidoreductase [Deinococcus marmoris]OLV15606.1 oxidoreductase/Short-chain dehydrogenase [Deinococcus marmoris]